MEKMQVRVYTDYKSPYAYIANNPLYQLEQSHNIELEWLPYTLRISEYLGSVEDRSPHHWRKIKYGYMDARRFANDQGLILKGPRRIYNGYYASAGMLFAQKQGLFRRYHDLVFQKFWQHQLDLDELSEMKAVMALLGSSPEAYERYVNGAGREEHDRIIDQAEQLGVFGVPTMLFDGELFWGGDRIDLLKRRIEEHRPGIAPNKGATDR
jgi:2-hydroxychromene-2-carboxylate isomerase